MQTQLQNTEVEESLAQEMANDDSNTESISFDGELIEDDEGNEGDVQEDVQEAVEASSDGSTDRFASPNYGSHTNCPVQTQRCSCRRAWTNY